MRADYEFTHAEAVALWARLVAGWANSLNEDGSRTLFAGVTNYADVGGSYEGITRMFNGLGAWLSQPDRSPIVHWHGEAYDIAALMTTALVNGCNPHSPHYWGRLPLRPGGYDQRTVETAPVALALWQSRGRVWSQLSDAQKAGVIGWLDAFGQHPGYWNNNWSLFWTVNHTARKGLGEAYDQRVIDETLDFIDTLYRGDGWYDDSQGHNHYDDYNWWVFTNYTAAWALIDGESNPARRDQYHERIGLLMRHYPYFFAADGAYTEYGRSLPYKFSRLTAPLWAYKLGVWPYSPGMLRRLVGRHLRWYVNRGAIRPDGTLRQELTEGGSADVRETYISTGATYWAMQAFAPLWSLPDDDPFWTEAEDPLPIETGDFVKVFPQPGWVVIGRAESGIVQRFSALSGRDDPTYHAKYAKFVYATEMPFNAGRVDGMTGPDSMLCLTDGTRSAHRGAIDAAAVGEPGWLRSRYRQTVGGGTHSIDTTIVTHGDFHLRAHRVTLDPAAAPIGAEEGPAPVSYTYGQAPLVFSDPANSWEAAGVFDYAHGLPRAAGIRAIVGYDGQHPAAAWKGRHDLNSVYPHYVLPLLTVSQLQPTHELICLVYAGRLDQAAIAELNTLVQSAGWDVEGAFTVTWRSGETVTIPPLG